jgi:hypothetical protein
VHTIAAATHDLAGNIVRDDPVRTLGITLGDCIPDDGVRFGGEADEQARALIAGGKLGEDIARPESFRLRRAGLFL